MTASGSEARGSETDGRKEPVDTGGSGQASHDHDHDHDHGHGHGKGHGHVHAPESFDRAFAIGTALNVAFVLVEGVAGLLASSMALLADASHNLSDVIGLLMAWGAARLAARVPTARFTYGLRSLSVLAALANGILLLVAVGAIVWEAVHRLIVPEPVAGLTVIVVAAVGIVINGITAAMFVSGSKNDVNIRGAFLHMAADAAVSLGVVIGGLLMLATGALWIDPALGLIVAGVIVAGTWGLLRDSFALALDAVPRHIDPAAVRAYLAARPGVSRLHDLHIWPISTTETALSCHLVLPDGHPGDAFLHATATGLKQRFGIAHATLQIERGDAEACALESDSVV